MTGNNANSFNPDGLNTQNNEPGDQPERHSAPATLKRPTGLLDAGKSTRGSRSTPTLTKSGSSQASSKVAIPRQSNGYTPRYNRRVPRACESCRQRKTKCSGDTPVCRQCRELRAPCQYPVGWRDKMKKCERPYPPSDYREIERLSAQLQDYENFLDDLRASADSRTADWVISLMEKYGLKGDHREDNRFLMPTPQNEMEPDEPSPLSSIGSLEAIDRVDEDPNRSEDTRATGVMGKSSEISWMQRVQKEAEQRAQGNPGTLESNRADDEKEAFSLHALNYHLDDLDISVPEPVQLYDLPPRQLADQLLEDYFQKTHPFFPIISKPLFRGQYQASLDASSRPNPARPGDKWLAVLNLIFAIGAKHAHLTNAVWRGEDNDHLVYLTRARLLSMNSDVLFSHPDLQQVQVEGLIAFYLLASDQINRAWRISALAIRSAITLGINLKITSPKTPSITKEARYRVWWCLYSFEHMLGIMTGRSIYSLDGGYATPLPLPFEEEQLQENPAAAEVLNNPILRDALVGNVMASSWIRPTGGKDDLHKTRLRDQSWLKNLPVNFGLCYLYYSDLTVVTQEILNKVYTTTAVLLPWSEIESRLDDLRFRIDLWKSSLPVSLDFTQEETNDSPDHLRCKLFLAFHYYSARITLGRPCLCRRDARQNNSPQTFSHTMALIALESANGMLDLIPDKPDVVQLYQVCPWWCVLRYLMQSATVFLLELSFGCIHSPEEEQKYVSLTKKSIRWFFAMSEHSIGSRRAWQICDSSFRNLASGMKYSTDDLPGQSDQERTAAAEAASSFPSDSSHNNVPSGDFFASLPTTDDLHLFGSHAFPDGGFNFPAPDLMSSLHGHADMTDDSYFPYDPLSGEFIRSFFPSSEEETKN
ncbi:hypothetical protein N7466_003900 [Penicillium verhagenii]|uniref:uncharacterized protein n=1 Tax=Penicillium verhagenii TaxID=1562060 RepID=UPI002544E759|nr:uncharacterized protein N7466_003900 [Penicillium verhagenii]KAJ5934353.1 hypothetical protein N7466_003900 [Penicillium verhagenii]